MNQIRMIEAVRREILATVELRHDNRPICPQCKEMMIKAALEVNRQVFIVWICKCQVDTELNDIHPEIILPYKGHHE